jgi:hypothetical protein
LRSWFWRWNDRRLWPAYFALHQSAVAYLRTRGIALLANGPSPQLFGQGSFDARYLPEEATLGFYGPEMAQDRTLRWTGTFAMLLLDLAPGRYRIRLNKGGERSDMIGHDLAVAVNGRLLPPGAFTVTKDALTIDHAAPPGARRPQRLLLLCDPLQKPSSSLDPRALGLPVFSVTVELADNRAAPRQHARQESVAALA